METATSSMGPAEVRELPPGPSSRVRTAYNWFKRPFEFLEECSSRYGDPFTLRMPGFPAFVIFKNPDAVKEIFRDGGDTLQGGRFYHVLRAFLGQHSVLMLDGREHKRQRKLLLPPFQGERMQAYGRVMIDITHDTMDRWPLSEPFSFYTEAQSITLSVIARVIFGVDEAAAFERIVRQLKELMDMASWSPLLLPFMQVDVGPLSPWGKLVRKRAQVLASLREEIAKRRSGNNQERTDILSLLMESRDEDGNPMSDDELQDELLTLLFAGHETTATSLTWALRWILGAPEVERRLREEVQTAVGEDGRLVPARVDKLEYLNAAMRESLRLMPAAPLVGRVLAEPYTIGGYSLPKGAAVVAAIYLSQRRSELYPEPQAFRPERFIGARFSPNEYYPFGGGIRRCIGAAFAQYELKMVLAAMLLRTEMKLTEHDIRPVRRLFVKPSNGLRVVLEARRPRPVVTSREGVPA